MSTAPVLLRHFAERQGMLPSAQKGLADAGGLAAEGRRERIWELSSNLHCSVIGTCLSSAELRQYFAKLKDPRAKTASEHEIHSLAVHGAGQRDLPGKLLNKMLDRRHESSIRRFSKAATLDEVRALWRDCLAKGDIPGAYWAVLTHPLTDRALVREAFGEVHMLSHLVGMSNRADIARLRELERDLGARDEKLTRQESRLQEMAQDRAALRRDVQQLQADLKRALAQNIVPAPVPDNVQALNKRLADEQAHAAALAERLAARDEALAVGAGRIVELERQVGALEQEVRALEAALPGAATAMHGMEPDADGPNLEGRRLLYVGGRPKQVEQVRALVERLGGVLLAHDGGVEETTALLPGLVSQADRAFLPVDCVSHLAASQVKRLCREAGKPFQPLRTASLASFAAALAGLAPGLPRAAE
ncbi:DUF2325 domain-containing protein [Azorhizobium doebereinerae]|uniref:DUF2325 domain-containing protein n=1 Tax=Azorhizobium doebereinerae TaxID=281091 RepID=UPI0012ECB6CE|nr:DUF2325 domain-containing protein [Azorhizobium doebereinerae]